MTAGGMCEAEVARVKRMIKVWQAEAGGYGMPAGYWALGGICGKRGPIALTPHTLEKAGMQRSLARRVIAREAVAVQEGCDLATQAAEAGKAARWRDYAQQRGCCGDWNAAATLLNNDVRRVVAGYRGIVPSYSISTFARAHASGL